MNTKQQDRQSCMVDDKKQVCEKSKKIFEKNQLKSANEN